MLWISLRRHVLLVSRTTLAGRQKNGGIFTVYIPSTRRSSNERSGSGPGDGQTHQSVKVGLYFFDIAYVTPHHLPFRDIEDDMASIACPFMLQYGQLPLFIAKLLSYVAALHYRYFCL